MLSILFTGLLEALLMVPVVMVPTCAPRAAAAAAGAEEAMAAAPPPEADLAVTEAEAPADVEASLWW